MTREKWGIWYSSIWCERVVGHYDHGATEGMASDLNKSRDTIEDRAHTYAIFLDLIRMGSAEWRFVHAARKLPYVYPSHFRVLYDIRERYDLTNDQIFSLLLDIVQAEGSISSRDLEKHAQSRFGVVRPWDYYGKRAIPALFEMYSHPDTPDDIRKDAGGLYSKLGDRL